MKQLVFIHGRAQEHKDATALKAEWIDALREGLAQNGLELPIPEEQIRFPFYGDALYDLVDGKSSKDAAGVIIRGETTNEEEKRFTRAILEEIYQRAGVSDDQIDAILDAEFIHRGPMNWEWIQAVVMALDRHVPHASGASIRLFTYDVYEYLTNTPIRNLIERGVAGAIQPGVETVVVGHSLGSVVAYNLLRREGQQLGWKIPNLFTVGSPLAVNGIRKTLKGLLSPIRCPGCVDTWFNAFDTRDIVALYPLDATSFPLDPVRPSIENYDKVRNNTTNRHGISGYLNDKHVASLIYKAILS